jgi:hypothetical protein
MEDHLGSQQEHGGYFALGALLGAAIGAALGLLYAPRPGSDTRQQLASRSSDLRQRAQQLGSEVESRSEDLVDRARELKIPPEREAGPPEVPVVPEGDEPDLPPGEDLL